MIMAEPSDTIARDEAAGLISSARVQGTVVYNPAGERLGTIEHFMVGKRDGRVRFAVLSFGGLFGLGQRYHPLPWENLSYDTAMGGYVVALSREQLEAGPAYEGEDEPPYDDTYGQRISDYYGGLV
jgi:hypothetical protein